MKSKVGSVWCTMCSQEWERNAPYKESIFYPWDDEIRLLRTLAHSSHKLQQTILDVDMYEYWFAYKERLPTTTPASFALYAGLKGFVAEHAIPRFVNSAGDSQLNVNWWSGDRIIDTNEYSKTYDREEKMQNRNWTSPFGVRDSLNERRTEKPC